MRRGGRDVTVVRLQSPADVVYKRIMARVSKAVIGAIKPLVDDEPCKLVKSFNQADIDKIIYAAVDEYEKAKHDEELAEELNDDISDVGVL